MARHDVRPGIPTIKSVLGHDFGDEVTAPEEIAIYLKALAAASPDRTRLVEYARTWEGRPLHVLAIASPSRISRLDQIKADLKRLADPRTLSGADQSRLLGELPVVTWLMHGVHGNEILIGCRTGRGVPPAGRPWRRDGRHDSPRVDRAD